MSRATWRGIALVGVALGAQVLWAGSREAAKAAIAPLPLPPPAALVRVGAFGQTDVLARVLMLWLQAYDNQPGVSVPLRALDYAVVEAWLALILDLDPGFQYPLLAAARLYAEVNEPVHSRRMLDFIARAYRVDPARRWPWMAHAVYIAKHRLHDLPYALALAAELDRGDARDAIPHWARQMRIFVLEDMGEIESAKILLGGLLASGEISDPHERQFLARRLHELERAPR